MPLVEPMTELEELQYLLAQPLPGGRGFQKDREERMKYLCRIVVASLVENMVDANGADRLAIMYLELLCNKEIGDPRIVQTKPFQAIWADYHPDEEEIPGD